MQKLITLLMVMTIGLYASEKIYLFNAIGDQGTISRIENGVISNNIANTGRFPNDIKFHNNKLFVLNSGTNNIKVFNEPSLSDVGSCEMNFAGSNPWKMAICNNKIYVTSLYGSGVEVWTTDRVYVKTIPIPGLTPYAGTGAAFTVDNKVFINRNNYYYDSNSGTTVYGTEKMFVINADTDEIVTSFTSGINVAAILTDNNNKLHVLCTGNRDNIGGYVKTFDQTTYTAVDSIYLGSQPGAFCKGSGNDILVAVSGFNPDWSGFGGVMKYNSATNQVVNGSTNLLYSVNNSGIMDICTDVSGKAYLPIFSNNQLVTLTGSTVNSTWVTGNGPQGMCYINTTEINDDESAKRLTMISAYPNPFNNSTKINFSLNRSAEIQAVFYNQNGQLVKNLAKKLYQAGNHSIDFNAAGFNTGMYYLKLSNKNQQIGIHKLLLVK